MVRVGLAGSEDLVMSAHSIRHRRSTEIELSTILACSIPLVHSGRFEVMPGPLMTPHILLRDRNRSPSLAARMFATTLGVAGIAGRTFGIAIHSLFRNSASTSRMGTFVGQGNFFFHSL